MKTRDSIPVKPVEILTAARDLIADRARFTVANYAKTAAGFQTNPVSKLACKWCSIGALAHVMRVDMDKFPGVKLDERFPLTVRRPLYLSAKAQAGDGYVLHLGRDKDSLWLVADASDRLPHPRVIAMWDHAIELAKQAEKRAA